MQLYEKRHVGKVVRYVEHIPAPIVMPAIEYSQVITLLSVLTISMLMSVEEQLPPHAMLARKIKKTEESVRELAALNATTLDNELVDVGVAAWNGAINAMQVKLSGGQA